MIYYLLCENIDPVLEREPKHTTGDTEDTEMERQEAAQGEAARGCWVGKHKGRAILGVKRQGGETLRDEVSGGPDY